LFEKLARNSRLRIVSFKIINDIEAQTASCFSQVRQVIFFQGKKSGAFFLSLVAPRWTPARME
jgi:hypothetical protein